MTLILDKDFFERSAPVVAKDMLGKYIVRKIGEETVALQITETEAYEGLDDLASHASKGKTKRTEVMFGEAGRIYIYLIYGMYDMLNVVTGKLDHPSAVLIRGTHTVKGPGRLTKALGIDRLLNTKKAIPENGLWFEDRGEIIHLRHIQRAPRIGVDYAGPIWAKKKWRFILIKDKR